MPPAHVLCLVLSVGALACGGRYERNAPESDEAPGQAGTSMGGSAMGGSATGGGATGGGAAGENACLARYRTYAEYRTKTIAEFESVGCSKPEDCVALHDQSDCDPACFRIVTGARHAVIDRLNAFKLTACSAQCLSEPLVPCPAAVPARCVAGRCL